MNWILLGLLIVAIIERLILYPKILKKYKDKGLI